MPFTLYKASAGSGKTYTLVRQYLRLALADPEKFRTILAITFTNKTAGEMKERIIRALVGLIAGREKDLLADLKKEMGAGAGGLETNARALLTRILHAYSDFAIMTIDSFVFRIIRSFAIELGLPPKFDVDLNVTALNEKLVDSLIDQIGADRHVEEVLVQFVLSKLRWEDKWNIEEDLKSVTHELFKELGRRNVEPYADTDFLATARALVETLGRERQALAAIAIDAERALGGNSELFVGGKGPGKPLRLLLGLPGPDADAYWEKVLKQVAALRRRPLQLKPNAAQKPASAALLKRLESLRDAAVSSGRKALSARSRLKTIYSLALMGKLANLAQEYKRDNAVIPISDFNLEVNRVVREETTPFIYWRTGERFCHYLIDEFQDTSRLQWENLLPLVENAVAEGKESLAVGDAKQAVYRWRAGDIEIMEKDLPEAFPAGVFVPARLDSNFRSLKTVVDFNNAFFACAGRLLTEGAAFPADIKQLVDGLYTGDAVRQNARRGAGGYVEVSVVGQASPLARKRVEPTLDRLVESIRGITGSNRGFSPGDIAVLVRKNSEGAAVAERLFAEGIDVVSPDSLLLNNQPSVRLMVGALRYLVYGRKLDLVQVVSLAAQLGLASAGEAGRVPWDEMESVLRRDDPAALRAFLPRGYDTARRTLARRPLYEVAEEIAREFALNRAGAHAGYVQALLEQAHGFSRKYGGDIVAFLKWWEEKNTEDSHEPPALVMPGEKDAVTIMTIHKAKGLEFPIVFVPFPQWRMGIEKAPLCWLRDDAGNPPFLVSVSKHTAETDFEAAYWQEQGRARLDNLNLLYVAFTRAREDLYIFVDAPKKETADDDGDDNRGETASQLIGRTLAAMDAEKPPLSTDAPRCFGSKCPKARTDRGRSPLAADTAAGFVSAEWRRRLAIRRKAERLWRMDDPDRAQKVDRGNLIHTLLSMIDTEADAARAVDALCSEGAVLERDRASLLSDLKRILDIEHEGVRVRDWFREGATVLKERTLLLQKDRLRPDRVVIRGKKVTVIDFKTGREEPEDATQVARYAGEIEKLGYEVENRFLLYTSLERIVRVEGGRR